MESSPVDAEAEKEEKASDLKNTPDSSTDKLTRKAGKQPSAQGFGRTQKIPVHTLKNSTHQNVPAVVEP